MLCFFKSLSELRETRVDISGGYYSEKYAERYNLINENRSRFYGTNLSVWVPELIEITLDHDSKILWRIKNANEFYSSKEEVFPTSKEIFVSHNSGEFGGMLITPKGRLRGNFIKVFECGNVIYAVDSLNHMGSKHMTIYGFSEKLEAVKLYPSEEMKGSNLNEELSFEALFVIGDRAYILASGIVECCSYEDNGEEYRSYLFEISNGRVVNKTELYYCFENVVNMIVNNNELIVGMDKVVAVVNLYTKEIKAYTPLSFEAENDIINTRVKDLRG